MSITLIKSKLHHPGGLEKYTWRIAQELCRYGHHVTLLTTGHPRPPFFHPQCHIVSLPTSNAFSISHVHTFEKACHSYLQHHPTPVVFSCTPLRFQTHHRAGNGVHAAYLHARKQQEGWLKGMSFTFNPLHRKLLQLEKQTFEDPKLHTLITNSSMVKGEILRHYTLPSEKIHVIHNGVEWEEMGPAFTTWQEHRSQHCMALSLDPSAFQLLFIGNNFFRKGLLPLFKALSLIRTEHFQLSIVGNDKSLPFFQKQALALGLQSKVFFFQSRTDTLRFYQLADTLVIPSFYDPFANVTVEALAMGVFVLSSRCNGGHEVLTADSGRIIPDLNDIQGFAHILKETLKYSKTWERAHRIRSSIQHLDFSLQLRQLTGLILPCLSTDSHGF